MIPDDHLEFLRTVWTRQTPFTFIFLGFNILIFVLMALSGGSTNDATLMAFGVKSNSAIAQGEIWRFVTPVFLHIGLLHLFFNSYALWIVGPQVEKLYGSERFVLLYILTGIAGVLGSYFYHPYAVSAGASGAIFGLFGVLLVFGIKYRNSIPPFFKRAVGTGVLPVIAINLIIGFTIPGIDNSAHIGGLLAGALLAGIVPFQRPGQTTQGFFRAIQVVLLLMVAVCFYAVQANYNGPRMAVRNLSRALTQISGTASTTQEFIDTINNAQKSFETSARELEANRLEGLARMRMDLAKSIDQLQEIPSLAAATDQLSSDLLRVMQDQYDLVVDVERTGRMTFAHDRKLKENTSRYEKLMKSILDWVRNEGPKYGIQMGNR
jgi:rhomboid protease GluP